MPKIVTPESEEGKMLAEWNKPYVYEHYPRMMYKASRNASGKVVSVDPLDESGSRGNIKSARDEHEEQRLLELGFRNSPDDAIALFKSNEDAEFRGEAERLYSDQRLSEKARVEAVRRDEELTADDGTKPTSDLGQEKLDKVAHCQAQTKSGKMCSNAPKAGERYCGKHLAN